MDRRLAAILAADVVGYSKLMSDDEAATLAALKTHRMAIFDPITSEHNGRIFKVMGDGILVEFSSVVDAVQCARVIQKKLNEYDGPIKLRIGINLGDIIVEGNDIYGDGVNVAARLEAQADPGGICVSDMVYQNVLTKLDIAFQDVGEINLKNIERPVRIWRWTPEAVASIPSVHQQQVEPQSIPAIAVLPFNNMSGDSEQEYFSDGISEDIITELSRSRSLLVVARNSSFQFRADAIDIRKVGEELNVNYVLEGSVRKSGQRIRVTAQLIDANNNAHVWADRYDGTIEDIFDLQDDITRTIVSTIVGRLDDVHIEQLAQRPTQMFDAYEHVLRGQKCMQKYSECDYKEARSYFREAIEIDPGFARAHAGLSLAAFHGWNVSNDSTLLDIAFEAGTDALAIDPHESKCHLALGMVHMFRAEHEKAEHHLTRALELNPNDDLVMTELGRFRMYTGKPLEGAELVHLAMRRNPYAPNWYWNILGRCYHTAQRYEEAITAFERIDTPQHFNHAYMAACHQALGHTDEAKKHVQNTLTINPKFKISEFANQLPYRSAEDLTMFLDGLRITGLPE